MDIVEFRRMMMARTIAFTVALDKMLRTLPACFAKKRLMDQLGRAGSSIGANFAESSAAESADDFIHKISVSLKEAEETQFWLGCVRNEFPELDEVSKLETECHEFVKILQSSLTTAKRNRNRKAQPACET